MNTIDLNTIAVFKVVSPDQQERLRPLNRAEDIGKFHSVFIVTSIWAYGNIVKEEILCWCT